MSKQRTLITKLEEANPPYIYTFEHFLCHGSFTISSFMLLTWLVEAQWFQQCVAVHHELKCMRYHKVII